MLLLVKGRLCRHTHHHHGWSSHQRTFVGAIVLAAAVVAW
jgi:hypothetical protein